MKSLVPTITKTLLAGAVAFGVQGVASAEVTNGINPQLVKGSITFYTNRTDLVGEPAEFGKNRTLRFSGHP